MLRSFFLAFIPLFVAVDAIGLLPIFVSLTQGMKQKDLKTLLTQSIVTASLLAIGFIFLGKSVFGLLGITIGDFMVAGGVILFAIALSDLLQPGKRRRMPVDELGAVPLGTPLIVGPAVLTTSLMSVDANGLFVTLLAVLANILLAGYIFSRAGIIIKLLGQSGTRALSKVMALLLAAIAVMMIRRGLMQLLNVL